MRASHFVLACSCFVAATPGCSSCDAAKPEVEPAALDAGASATASAPSIAPSAGTSWVDVTTHASTTEDASAPAVVASGSVDGARLRAQNRARLAADTTPVVILRGGTARELGERICKEAMPMRPAETPVLLKPNLGGFDWFKDPKTSGGDDGVTGRITDPEFVRGVVRCLKARGHARITIADGWGGGHKDWERLLRVSGYGAMAREEGVRIVAMDDDGVFDVEGDQPGKPLVVRGMERTTVPSLLMPKLLAEHLERGLFVSLPKIKAHRFGVVSLGIKGMQGTVMLSDASPAHKQKWRMHRELQRYIDAQNKKQPEDRAAYVSALERFAARMADVLDIEAPHAVLAEGASMMGGDGFQRMWPSTESLAIGGTNVVRVDRVGAELLGLWDNQELARELGGHLTSPLLEAAARKLGVDLASPSVRGDGAALLQAPRPVHFVGMAPFAIHSDAAPLARVSGAAASEKPVARAPHVAAGAITIDGRAGDAAWARATPVTWDTDYAGRHAGITTKARFAWSDASLFVLWELEGAGLHVDTSRPTGVEREGLYKEDCVELFFTPDARVPRRYYEIEVGPFGHFFDLDVDRAAKTEDIAWSSGARIGTTRDAAARTAVIEIELTAPEIAKALRAGARLPIGLYRMEGATSRAYLAWSPPLTAKPSFHVPEAFGALVLEP